MWRGCGEEGGAFPFCDGDVAGADAGVLADAVVELWGGVVFPEPAEDVAQAAGFECAGREGVAASFDCVVEFGDVRGGQPRRREGTSLSDEGFGRLVVG